MVNKDTVPCFIFPNASSLPSPFFQTQPFLFDYICQQNKFFLWLLCFDCLFSKTSPIAILICVPIFLPPAPRGSGLYRQKVCKYFSPPMQANLCSLTGLYNATGSEVLFSHPSKLLAQKSFITMGKHGWMRSHIRSCVIPIFSPAFPNPHPSECL